ncbi:MAG: cytochrome c oxidase subunit 3 [Candidatus Acidiferrales bacterium]
MATTSVPPRIVPKPEQEAPLSDHNGNGFGGGNFDEPNYGPHDDSESDPNRWSVPLSAYRSGMWVAIVSIISLFLALTRVLEARWVNSKDWVSVPLPHVLYLNTAVLLASSLAIELARFSLRAGSRKRCALWLSLTMLLGLIFVGGQLIAWQELASHGVYLASHPGSFFFYLITATHGLHVLGGIIALACIILCAGRLQRKGKQQTAVGVVALYWHFMDGLWLYLFALLFITVQR